MEPFNILTVRTDEKNRSHSQFFCPWMPTVPEKWKNKLITQSQRVTSLVSGMKNTGLMCPHWATRGPYAKDSSQAFTSVWVTLLSPQWTAPGTCRGGLPDYLSIKLKMLPCPASFLRIHGAFLEEVLTPPPPVHESQLPRISLCAQWNTPCPSPSMHLAC